MTLREQLRRARPTVDGPTYRLLTGQITDDEYWRIRDAEYRGLRIQVGRPGWQPRVPRPLQAIFVLAFVLLLLAALCGEILLIWAATLPVPQ